MIEISNLRKYTTREGLTRLEADITFTDMAPPCAEKTLYFELDKKYSYMFAEDTYDAFVLVPLWLAMLHKQDLHIRGKISAKLYQNIKWYVQKIWCDFYEELAPVKLIVDGFAAPPKKRGKIIGTGISCGVDSLSTVYDHFIRETDPNYRINALFYFNCGIFGEFDDPKVQELTKLRNEPGKNVAKALGLPCYCVNSNLHAFRKLADMNKLNFISVYSCALSLSNAVSRYYVSSGTSYEEIKAYRDHYHNRDMSAFCESYLVPLIQTERTELIVDGCQYRRVDKLRNIADWDIARKYLNVCWRYTPDGSNCSMCVKCLRTLLPLEILGKLDDFAAVFDVEEYRKISFRYKIRCLQNYGEDPFETENVDFARENNFPMPERHDCYVLNGQLIYDGD